MMAKNRRRDKLVADAASDGRIADTPENRARWRVTLDQPGGEALLARLERARGPKAPEAPRAPRYASTDVLTGWGDRR